MENYKQRELAWGNATPKLKKALVSVQESGRFDNGRLIGSDGKDYSDSFELTPKVNGRVADGYKAINKLGDHATENGGFILAFYDHNAKMSDQLAALNFEDLARLVFIGTYISYEKGRLQHDNGRSINKKGLAELVGLKERAYRDFFKRLVAANIIREEVDGTIHINPAVFYRGEITAAQAQSSARTKIYVKTVRDLYTMAAGSKRNLKHLATIYEVLPFINFHTNIIAYNPEETDADLIKPMAHDKLAALLGYQDARKLRQTLNASKIDGKPVFLAAENPHDRREKRIVVNPRVVYGGTSAALDGIKALFN